MKALSALAQSVRASTTMAIDTQFKKMRAEGIDYIQGYFYSKPLPAADFVSFLRSNNAA